MSLVSLSAVSSIHTTGNSITIGEERQQHDLDGGAELAPAARTGGGAVSPAIPASATAGGWM